MSFDLSFRISFRYYCVAYVWQFVVGFCDPRGCYLLRDDCTRIFANPNFDQTAQAVDTSEAVS